jgi:DNA-binding NarL/FixJ family response regulator
VEAGAKSCVLKDGASEIMLKAIETVHAGSRFFSPCWAVECVSQAIRQHRPVSAEFAQYSISSISP